MDVEISLEDLRRRPNEGEQKIDPEAAVMRLAEWAERYAEAMEGPRFEVGDLVTPSKDCRYDGAGRPHRVIQIRIVCTMNDQPGICAQEDMRIIWINDIGDVLQGWAESAMFERWVAPI